MPEEARQVVNVNHANHSREILPACRDVPGGVLKAYHVKQWDAVHENHETRKVKRLSYVNVPIKQDGLGFRHMVLQANPEELVAAWNLILQVSARGDFGARGWLVRGEKPLTALDLSVMTGLKQKIFERALKFFVHPPADWLEVGEFPGTPGPHPAMSGNSPGTPGQAPGLSGLPEPEPEREPELSQKKREREGAGAKLAEVAASRTQAGALLAQIKKLESFGRDLRDEERVELRKKRAALAELQKKQAEGNFKT